jgi:hypothetical protein
LANSDVRDEMMKNTVKRENHVFIILKYPTFEIRLTLMLKIFLRFATLVIGIIFINNYYNGIWNGYAMVFGKRKTEESTTIDEKPCGNKADESTNIQYGSFGLAYETVHDFSTRCLMK